MRPKEEISNLTTLYNVDSRPSFVSSMRSSVLYSSDAESSRPRNGFINLENPLFVSDLRPKVYSKIPTVKLKIPGKLFLKSNPELLLQSSYSFDHEKNVKNVFSIFTFFYGCGLAKSQSL